MLTNYSVMKVPEPATRPQQQQQHQQFQQQLSQSGVSTPQKRLRTLSVSSNASSQTMQSQSDSSMENVKISCSASNFEQLLNLALANASNTKETQDEDEKMIFGKMVGYKLRGMDPQQAYIAEKIITDILLEGQMKMLSYPNCTTSAPVATTRATVLPTYRQDGQTFVISGVNLNGGQATAQLDRQHHQFGSARTIQYKTSNGTPL